MDGAAARPETMARVSIASDGTYRDANPLALELLGVTRERLRTHRVGDFTVPELRDASRASWQHMAATGQMQLLIDETFLLRPDGTAHVVKVHPVMPGEEPGRVVVVAVGTNPGATRPGPVARQATAGAGGVARGGASKRRAGGGILRA